MSAKRSLIKRTGIVIAILLGFASIPPAMAYGSRPETINKDQLAAIATAHFEKLAKVMVSKSPAPPSAPRPATDAVAEPLVDAKPIGEAVTAHRDELARSGERYSSSRSSATIDSVVRQADGSIKAVTTETTFLTIEGAGVETGYATKHELTFAPTVDGSWRLREAEYLEPTGLLPLGQAESLVKPDAEYFRGIAQPTEALHSLPPASTEHSSDSLLPEKSSLKGAQITPNKTYNYSAMGRYLERYWRDYNPKYRSFTGSGGDCTNFVSQALREGGWEFKSGWYRNANHWWYGAYTQTYSWTSVDYWATFARNSGRTRMLSNVWQLRVGDVLQVTKAGGSQKVHTMMVSHFANGVPYFTYHTSDRYRRSMHQVLTDWKGSTFYAYRT